MPTHIYSFYVSKNTIVRQTDKTLNYCRHKIQNFRDYIPFNPEYYEKTYIIK